MELDPSHWQTRRMAKSSVSTWEASRLRAIRDERGWSTERMAVATGTGIAAMRGYLESRVVPSPQALSRLAAALEVETTDLAPLTDSPTMHERRWHQGLTARDLAVATETSLTMTGRYLRGAAEIPLEKRDAWQAALGVDADALQRLWEQSRRELVGEN